MGRPRTRNKDLPRGLYRDRKGRISIKAFTEQDRERLGGKSSMSFGRNLIAARTKWAEVYGFRELEPATAGTFNEIIDRYLIEELPRLVKDKKTKKLKPKYSPRTVKEYKRQIKKTIRPKFGVRRYAKSEADAVRGDFLRTHHFQTHLADGEKAGIEVQSNRDVSVASAVFAFGIRVGLTQFNPCLGVERHQEVPRDQQPDDPAFLELYAEASPALQCFMDQAHMVGSRISDILRTMEADWTPGVGLQAVPAKARAGQARRKQLFRAEPDLSALMERALALKAATMARIERKARKRGLKAVSSLFLYPNPLTGQPYSLSGFESMFRRSKERLARKRLGPDADAAAILAFVQQLDRHFHDGRRRAADDADKRGEDATDFLGHAPGSQTARRHYLNAGVTMLTPNPRIKG